MVDKIKSAFRSEQQFRLFSLLTSSTLFCFLLFLYRLYHTGFDFSLLRSIHDLAHFRGAPTFIFLNWNLFLAWIPYLIALSLPSLHRYFGSKIIIAGILLTWLLFFPNAPYIITDLLHLKKRVFIPFWYDVMLLVSFGWTGLMLGFLSLYEVQLFLQKIINRSLAWIFSIGSIFLCSFGIYLGRFQRWNSWDIFTDPISLLTEAFTPLVHPMDYAKTLGLPVVFSAFLILGYLTLIILAGGERKDVI